MNMSSKNKKCLQTKLLDKDGADCPSVLLRIKTRLDNSVNIKIYTHYLIIFFLRK